MSEQDVRPEQQTEPTNVRVRYDQTDASFAAQFLINATPEELIVNFSSGYIPDPQTKERLLPIQTRIAMSYSGAARLVDVLTTAMRNMQESKQRTTEGSPDSG